GLKDHLALVRNCNRNLLLGTIVSIALVIILALFHSPIFNLLIKDDGVWQMYPNILPFLMLCLPINAVAFVMDGIFKGAGKAKLLRNVLIISTLLGFVPVLLIGDWWHPNIEIIWWAILVWMTIRAVL